MDKIKLFGLLVLLILNASCNGQTRQEQRQAQQRAQDETSIIEKQQQGKPPKVEKADLPARPDVPAGLDFRVAARTATPGVVHIRSTATQRPSSQRDDDALRNIPEPFRDFFGEEFFRQGPDRPQQASGSGVIISPDGYIVTNNHVIENADEIEVTLYDNRVFTATRIGTDPTTDLALLKIDDAIDFPFIPFGNSDAVEVGDWVLAVGNPFNLASTVTAGIISAKGRNINILREQGAIESFIQTDAAVNPGNSGGALVDLDGRLVGINTAIATPTGTYAGYSFAVPVNIAIKIIDDLLNFGVVQRGYLGVYIRSMDGRLANEMGIDVVRGILVDSIISGSAAESAGIREKDIITQIDEVPVNSAPELQEQIGRKRPGDQLKVTLIRNSREREISLVLKNREGNTDLVERKDKSILDQLGLKVDELTSSERKELKLDGGVKVTGIDRGIISQSTDMREGFIILRVDKKQVRSVEELIEYLNSSDGAVMLEGVYPNRAGRHFYAFGLN